MLKQCALAFAQSKPTEWDYFRQEWSRKKEEVAVLPVFQSDIDGTEKLSEREPVEVSVQDVGTVTEVLAEQPLQQEMAEELKSRRSRVMKKEELE